MMERDLADPHAPLSGSTRFHMLLCLARLGTRLDESRVKRYLGVGVDAAGVKRVHPAANEASLQSAFREMRALEVLIDDIQVLSEDGTATRVSCRVRQTLIPKAGSRKSIEVNRVIRLRRQNNSWVIDAFER
jgi:hypothetical protein